MGLPERLVRKLGCPQCHGALDYVEKDDNLKCPKCRLAFRIENDIPVLVLEEAEELQ